MKTVYRVTVTGTTFDKYELEAEDHDEAEKLAKDLFKSDHGSHDVFDDIQAEAIGGDDE